MTVRRHRRFRSFTLCLCLTVFALSSGLHAAVVMDSSGSAFFKEGTDYFYRGKLDSAVLSLNRALARDSALVPAYDVLGRCLAERGDCQEADRVFTLGLGRDSNNVEILSHAGQSAFDCGSLLKSELYYRKAILLAPGHSRFIARLAQVFIQESTYDSAIAILQNGLVADSNSLTLHYLLGYCQYAKKKYNLAIEELGKAVAINRAYFPAVRDLASSYYLADSIWYALAEYEYAVSLQPGNPGLQMSLANCYFKSGQYRKALDLMVSLEGTAFGQSVRVQEGLCYYYMAEYDSAADRFRAALRSDSTEPATWFDLGLALTSLKQYRPAIASFKRAVLLGKTELTASAYDRIGFGYYNLRQKDAALRAYRQAVDEKPLLPKSHYNLGVLYENSFSDVRSATACYKKVVALSPPSDDPNSLYYKAKRRLAILRSKSGR